MAFANTASSTATIWGNMKIYFGTWTNSGASSNSTLTVGGTVLGPLMFVSSQGALPLAITTFTSSSVVTVSVGSGDTSGYYAFYGK
jgi:hypothetical protein